MTERAAIFHLALRSNWERAKSAGSYEMSTREQTLQEVGFIHCSFEEQLLGSAARFYADVEPTELTVLVIEPTRLTAPLVVEPSSSGVEFPHIYGGLNPEAVVATIPLLRDGSSFGLGEREAP